MSAFNRTIGTAVSWAGSESRLVRSGLSIALLALAVALLLPAAARALSIGPNAPSTAISHTTSGPPQSGWVNPGNVTADDASYAESAIAAAGGVSAYLEASGFGFAIPGDATIAGIEVSITRRATGIHDSHLYLMKAGSMQTAGDRATATEWPATAAPASYGGASDLWDNTWTPAEINASGFGVALQAVNTDAVAIQWANVGYVTVTITYTQPIPLTVTATGVDKVYDGTTTATVTLASGDIASGDSVTLAYASAAFADKDVGAGKSVAVSGISLGGADAAKYALQNTTASTTADVTPKGLTVTAGDQSKAYGSTFTFAGTEFSTAGLVTGDAVDSATLVSAGAAAGATPGTYPITASAAVGTGLGNYTITYVDGTMTVGAGYKVTPFAKPLRHSDSRHFHVGDTIRVAFRVKDAAGEYVTGAKPRLRVYRGGKVVLGPKAVRYVASEKMYVYNLRTGSDWKAATYKIRISLPSGSTGRSVFFRLNPQRPVVIPAYRG